MKEWDQFWKEYKTSRAEMHYIMLRDKIIRDAASRCHTNNIRILEAGCGYGSNSRILNNDNKFNVYCLDSSREAIEKVRNEIRKSFVGDIQQMPFSDNYFDIVFSSGVIEHFKDDGLAVSELYRVTRKNGLIITFVPGRYSLWQLYKIAKGKNWVHGYEKNYTVKMLKQSFKRFNVSIIRTGGIDPFSINGLTLKLFNLMILPNKSLPSCYGEIYLIAKKT